MSALTGIPPQSLIDLDASTYDEVIKAVSERWTVNDELTAQAVEVNHAAYVSGLAGAGVKTLPDPYHVQRPWEPAPGEKKPVQVSAHSFMNRFRNSQ